MEQPVTKKTVSIIRDLDLGGNKIVNLKEPLSNFDTVNKEYVDRLFTRLNDRIDQLCKL